MSAADAEACARSASWIARGGERDGEERPGDFLAVADGAKSGSDGGHGASEW